MPFDGIVTKAVIEELQTTLIPGKITKIYQPTPTELLLTIRSQGKNNTLLLSIHPTYARFHITKDTFENPSEPPMFCMLLRKYLSGAIIEAIDQLGMERIITFTVNTRNEIGDIANRKLVMELMGKHSNIMLIDEDKGHIIGSMKHVSMAQNRYRTILPGAVYKLPPLQNKLNPLEIVAEDVIKKLDFNSGHLDKQIVQTLTGISPFIAKEIIRRAGLGSINHFKQAFTEFQHELINKRYTYAIYENKKEDFHVLSLNSSNENIKRFPTANKLLDHFYSGKAERDRVKQQAKDLYRFIKNERDKNERKLSKQLKTIKKAVEADKFQKQGELLTANMHLVKKGDSEVEVIDYYDPEQSKLTIGLDPHKTPSENAQSLFKTYQKLKTSKKVMEEEVVKTKAEIAYLDQLLQQIDVAGVADIAGIREELTEQGYLKRQVKQGKEKNKSVKPTPETYVSSEGTEILVGKNNKQNEYLTMKLARRDEFWLHTKDIPGSHVVIRSKNPADNTLLEAANLAAFFSKSQNSSSVPVDYTLARHVKKPNGAKPGFVIYEQQKTIFVTPDKELVERLKNNVKN